jgi:hypothetical protein
LLRPIVGEDPSNRLHQEMPMKWALYDALRRGARHDACFARDLFRPADARGERVRARSSYPKKFLRIFPRGGLPRAPARKKVRESLASDSAEASTGERFAAVNASSAARADAPTVRVSS